MKKVHWLTWTAWVLWLLTVSVGSYFFVFGTTVSGVDKRTEVRLNVHEREFVLNEMRTLLSELQGVVDGLARDDMKAVSVRLSNMGMKMAADDSPTLLGKLPLALKTMGLGLHKKMDELSEKVAKNKINKKELLQELSTSLGTCVGCHSTYRISLAPSLPVPQSKK